MPFQPRAARRSPAGLKATSRPQLGAPSRTMARSRRTAPVAASKAYSWTWPKLPEGTARVRPSGDQAGPPEPDGQGGVESGYHPSGAEVAEFDYVVGVGREGEERRRRMRRRAVPLQGSAR